VELPGHKSSIIARLSRIGGLLLFLTLGGLAALYMALKESDALLVDVFHVAEPIQEAVLEIEIDTVGATLAVVQYLDTADPMLRERFEKNTARIQGFLVELRRFPLDQAEQGTLREIERRYEELHDLGEKMMARQDVLSAYDRRSQRFGKLEAARSGMTSEAVLRMREEQSHDRHELFRRRENLAALLDKGIQILAEEGVSVASQSAVIMIQRVTMLVIVLAFLLGAACFLATLAIARRLIHPLRAMVDGANAFARGDFSHRIQHQGSDEVGHVIATLNAMAGRLGESHASLEKQVATRTGELDAAKRVLETTLESIDDAVIAIDPEGRVQFMNRTAERLIGQSEDQVRGRIWRDVIPLVDHATGQPVTTIASKTESGDTHAPERNWCLRGEDGDLRDVDISVGKMTDAAGSTVGSVLVLRNAEQARQLQRRLAHQADHDTLTELPNRVMFGRELDRCLARASRQHNEVAVLFMDLDGFKEVNDVHGHAVGDEILLLVAQRLLAMTRPMDLIARLGGDEFCLAIEHHKDAFPFELTERILRSLSAPYEVNAMVLNLSASIGIARYPQDGAERAVLMSYADAAMYEAKKAGKNRYAFHDREIRERAEARAAIVDGLRHALKHDGLELYYQPQIALDNGALKGVEALIRWRRDGQLVLPGEFLPIAEDAGLMPEIDRWVVTTACAQLRKWQDADLKFRLAINATGEGLRRSLVEELESAIHQHQLDPALIEVEITESRLLEDEPVLAAVRRLREIGVRVAIDDFGTGYSSFAALRELPVDCLKIDRSFVHSIELQPKQAAIVSAIMGTAYVLGLEVVAEGIEERAQANLLMTLGCLTGQGLYFSGPVPASEIPTVVDRFGLSTAPSEVAAFLPRTA
jgi:diguanylate cyclase (GGDEF)-like protein/PAS domain S-box-containing protein